MTITRVNVVVTITYFSLIESSIVKTRPKAIAPLINPAYEMKTSYLKDTCLLCPNKDKKYIRPTTPVNLPTNTINIYKRINSHDQSYFS